MAIGLNRHNDTPIGGAEEFRGNMQGEEVFAVDDVPVWDGEKFAPGTSSGLVNSYGGLADGDDVILSADGSNIQNWDEILPLNGTPKQLTIDAVAGTITLLQAGDYEVSFAINASDLVNGVPYDFFLALDGVPTFLFAEIVGSNQVQSQSTAFSLMTVGNIGSVLSMQPTAPAGQNYTTRSMTFSVKRIG